MPPAATRVAVSRADDRSSTLRTSSWPYLSAPARSAWPGRSRVTGLGAKPSFDAVISAVQLAWSLFSSTSVTGLPMVKPPRTPLTMRAKSVSIFWRPPRPWPPWRRATDGEGRLARLRALLPDLPLESATELAADIITRSRDLNGGTVMVPELIRIDADELITLCLNDHHVALRPSLVMQVRRAMAIPIDGQFQPLPGARELLATIRELGLRCVVASNPYWRDAESYWDDLRLLGWEAS